MSAESRLTFWASWDDDTLTTSEEVDTTIVQYNIIALVERAIGFEGLVSLRVDQGSIEVFKVLLTIVWSTSVPPWTGDIKHITL